MKVKDHQIYLTTNENQIKSKQIKRKAKKIKEHNKYTKRKNGINIPICFIKKINGYVKWSIIPDPSRPVLFKPYKIVMKSFLKSHIRCGTNKTKNTSKEIKYLKSNFLVFLKKIT